MSSDLVEKVAEFLGNRHGYSWEGMKERGRENFREEATEIIPIIRQETTEVIEAIRAEVKELNKKLDDREADLINAKQETRQEIANRIYTELPTGELSAFDLVKWIKEFQQSLQEEGITKPSPDREAVANFLKDTHVEVITFPDKRIIRNAHIVSKSAFEIADSILKLSKGE